MSSYDRALQLVEKLQAAGIAATADPRSATPPCVLVTPPGRLYDLTCGYTATWQVWAVVPGPGNADSFKALDTLADQISGVLEVRQMLLQSYVLAADNPPYPAYRIDFEEALSWP